MEKITTGSENTIRAYEFLRDNKGQAFSIKQIAEALEVSTSKILGGLTSLNKKGIINKGEATVEDKVVKVYSMGDSEVEFAMDEPKKMSDKSVRVLQYLQGGGDGQTHKEIASGMGLEHVASVVGVINSLVKKNLVTKSEVEVEMGEGEAAEVKKLQIVELTEEGRNYTF